MRLRRTQGTRRARPRRRMPRKIRRQRRGRSAFTSIKVSYSTYLTMSSVGGRLAAYATSNIHIQNIMSNLITSTPNVTNFIAAYEFVALKSAGFHSRTPALPTSATQRPIPCTRQLRLPCSTTLTTTLLG